jgi:hypothetical protein
MKDGYHIGFLLQWAQEVMGESHSTELLPSAKQPSSQAGYSTLTCSRPLSPTTIICKLQAISGGYPGSKFLQ